MVSQDTTGLTVAGTSAVVPAWATSSAVTRPCPERDDVPRAPRRPAAGALADRSRRAGPRVRPEPGGAGGPAREGPAAAHGPRRPPVLRAADLAPLLRHRAELQRERRAGMLPPGVPRGERA